MGFFAMKTDILNGLENFHCAAVITERTIATSSREVKVYGITCTEFRK